MMKKKLVKDLGSVYFNNYESIAPKNSDSKKQEENYFSGLNSTYQNQ